MTLRHLHLNPIFTQHLGYVKTLAGLWETTILPESWLVRGITGP